MPPPSRAIVLLNAKAGLLAASTADDTPRIRQALESAGIQPDIRPIPGHQLSAETRRALDESPPAIIVGGGDGTMSSVAGALAGTDIPLGVLPLGTFNHFARDLRIPTDLSAAARVIATGNVAAVDVATVNGRVFINNSSIGIYPQLVRDRDQFRQRLGRGKGISMLLAVLAALRRFPVLRVRISVEDRSILRTTPFVFVGNNEYEMSLLAIRDRKRMDAATLSLYVANRTGRFGMIRLAFRALFQRLDQARDFDSVLLPQLWIESGKRRLHVALDGEVLDLVPPLHYQSRPRALRVFVPPLTVVTERARQDGSDQATEAP